MYYVFTIYVAVISHHVAVVGVAQYRHQGEFICRKVTVHQYRLIGCFVVEIGVAYSYHTGNRHVSVRIEIAYVRPESTPPQRQYKPVPRIWLICGRYLCQQSGVVLTQFRLAEHGVALGVFQRHIRIQHQPGTPV